MITKALDSLTTSGQKRKMKDSYHGNRVNDSYHGNQRKESYHGNRAKDCYQLPWKQNDGIVTMEIDLF